jgi:DNA repair exonuclease SbcCD ATPase subunit
MNLFDSHGEAPHPLQQQLIFDTSQAKQELKDFAETAVKSLKEAEDEARKLAVEMESLVKARLKFNSNPNQQRVHVVNPEGDIRALTKVKLDQNIKSLNEQYQKALKLAQDLAREEYSVQKAVEGARKANQLFAQDLEKNPGNISKIKNAYAELETQIEKLSKVQLRSSAQDKYLKDLKNAYQLNAEQIEHLIDLEHKYAGAIKETAEAERQQAEQAKLAYEAEKQAAIQAQKNAQALKAIQANPNIRPTVAFSSNAERNLRESALRAAFNSKEFEQQQIKLNVRTNLAVNKAAVQSSGFNVSELEKQSRERNLQAQKEDEKYQQAQLQQQKEYDKLRYDEAVKSLKALEESEAATRKRTLDALKADIVERSKLEQQKYVEAVAARKQYEAEEAALRQKELEQLKADIITRSKTETELEEQKYAQLVKDLKAYEKAVEDQRKRELEQLKADIIARSKAQQEADKTIAGNQKKQLNRPQELDKSIQGLTTQYLRAKTALESLQKASNGFPTKGVKDASEAVDNYKKQLHAALEEADALSLKTANVARAQAALTGVTRGLKNPFSEILDVTSKLGFAFYGVQNAIYAILTPFQLLKKAFIDTNAEMDQLSLGFASTFNNIFKESFTKSVERAESFVKRLRDESTKSLLTFQELLQVEQTVLPQVLSRKGGTPEAALTIGKRIGEEQKILFGADKFDPGRVRDEVTSFLNGQIKTRSNETLVALGITKEDLQNAKTMDERIQLLEKHTQGLKAAETEFSEHFTGSLKELQNHFFQLEAEIGKPLFAEVTKSLSDFNKELEKGQFNPLLSAIQDIVDAMAHLIRLTREYGDTLDSSFSGQRLAGILSGNPVDIGMKGIHLFDVNAQRQFRNSDIDGFVNDYKDNRKVLNAALYEVRKEQQNILNDKGLLGTGILAPSQKDIKQRLATKNYQEVKLMQALGLDKVLNNDAASQRRNKPSNLTNDGKAVLPPKSIVEGLPKLSDIDQATKHYNEAIRDIDSSNKELQSSLNAIDPGGLVGISKELDAIKDKIATNSSARDSVLGIIEDLTKKTQDLSAKFENVRSKVLANPKDKQSTQQAEIFKDQFTKAQTDLEKAKSEYAKLEDTFNDLQANLTDAQTKQTNTIRSQRVELAGLHSDLTDLQNALSDNAIQQAFDKLGTAARRSNADIKNLREEVTSLNEGLSAKVTVLKDGKIKVNDNQTLTVDEQARLERLKILQPQLDKAVNQKLDDLNNLAVQAVQTLESQIQESIDQISKSPLFTQKQKDAFAFNSNAQGQDAIQQILKTGIAGGQDLKKDGVLPPNTELQLEKFKAAFQDATLQIRKAYTVNVIDAGKQAFDSFFDSVLNGTANFAQAFVGLFKDIATQIERIFSAQVADKLNQILFKGLGGPTIGLPSPSGNSQISPSSVLAQTAPFLAFARSQPLTPGQGVQASVQQAVSAQVAQKAAVQAGATAGTSAVGGIITKALPPLAALFGAVFAGKTILSTSGRQRLTTTIGSIGGSGIGALAGGILAGAFTGGLGAPAGALIGAGIGSGVGASFGKSSSRGAVLGAGGGALAGAGIGALIAGSLTGGLGAPVGALIGSLIGGGAGGFLGGSGSRAQKAAQAKRNAYQDNTLTPFLDNVVSSADSNSLTDLQSRLLQAARGQKGNGSRGMAMKIDAMNKILALIDDLNKRIAEANKQLGQEIDDLSRPLAQRGIVPNIQKALDDLQQQLKMGVDPNKIFEAFNLSIRDQVDTLQQQLDATVKQINQGAEDDKGNQISLAKALTDQIEQIQKDAQQQLESLRQNFASQASSIIGEGRASAITPSASSRQQRLALLSKQEKRSETDLQTQTTNSILKATNETNREIADLQKQANDTLGSIRLLLSTAISDAPSSLAGFSTAFLQSLQSFLNNFNPFQSLALAPALEGGLGINIDKLVLPNDMDATTLGQAILDAIAKAQQDQEYKRTAQQA